jgi:hypothetical protein
MKCVRGDRAMERRFHPKMTTFVNWNNFAGRLFVPGPLGNNKQKGSPDSGYGSHDWFTFGRARGSTTLWTVCSSPLSVSIVVFCRFVERQPLIPGPVVRVVWLSLALLRQEDWFGSGDAWQWSYYANRLRSAAELAPDHDVTFGGYIVGRDATPKGLAQKMLALAGSGAKALRM